jgi:hypothetical protein
VQKQARRRKREGERRRCRNRKAEREMTGGRYIRGSGRKLKEFQKVPASNKARRTAGMLTTLFLFPPIIIFLQVPPCPLIPLPILSSPSSLQSQKYFETFLGFAIGLLCRQKL